MKSYSRFFALLIATSVVTLAAESMAQENTPAACADRVDNDGDGHVDCGDQDCMYMTFCASGGPPALMTGARAGAGRGLFISGTIVSSIGLLAGSAALGLATQSTRDDAFLFSSIGVGLLGFTMSIVGGGLHVGGQARAWRVSRASGRSAVTGLGITSVVFYGLMVLGGTAVAAMGPTVGPATGVGSAPFWGPALGLELISFSVLLPAGIVAMRRAATASRGSSRVAILPYVSRSQTTGNTVIGLTAVF